MPLPQVNDRLKEVPAQALRTVFATIGQLLLVADRLRARAVEQLSGSGETPAGRPSDQPPAVTPPPPAKPAAQDTGSARWRSLDKTGNVRLLDGAEQDGDDLAGTATPAGAASVTTVPEPSFQEPAVPAVPEPATVAVPEPAVPAVPEPATVAVPEPAVPAVSEPDILAVTQSVLEAVPAPAEYTPTEPVPSVPALAGPALPMAPAGEALPVPNYDQISVASLRARLRVLDAGQVQVLLDYEKAHEGRLPVITMFERRLAKLGEGS